MRAFSLLLIYCCLFSCGNIDQGKERKPQKEEDLARHEYLGYPGYQFGPCRSFSVYVGDNPAFSQVYIGSSVCVSTSHRNRVLVKVAENFPTGNRFCILPLSTTHAFPETCFTVESQTIVALQVDTFTSLILLAETDVAAYKHYLAQGAGRIPPFAAVELR